MKQTTKPKLATSLREEAARRGINLGRIDAFLNNGDYGTLDNFLLAVEHIDRAEGLFARGDVDHAIEVLRAVEVFREVRETVIPEARRMSRVKVAASGADAKKANDPIQAIKPQVKERWLAWRAGARPKYDSKAAFARAMLSDFSALTTVGTVENWTRGWEQGKA
jgi:hypothetical protein